MRTILGVQASKRKMYVNNRRSKPNHKAHSQNRSRQRKGFGIFGGVAMGSLGNFAIEAEKQFMAEQVTVAIMQPAQDAGTLV